VFNILEYVAEIWFDPMEAGTDWVDFWKSLVSSYRMGLSLDFVDTD
jgi:hypothetical protein